MSTLSWYTHGVEERKKLTVKREKESTNSIMGIHYNCRVSKNSQVGTSMGATGNQFLK